MFLAPDSKITFELCTLVRTDAEQLVPGLPLPEYQLINNALSDVLLALHTHNSGVRGVVVKDWHRIPRAINPIVCMGPIVSMCTISNGLEARLGDGGKDALVCFASLHVIHDLSSLSVRLRPVIASLDAIRLTCSECIWPSRS